jgi:hypothetical protein
VTWFAHNALNHLDDAGTLEQMHLLRVFLEDACESETLHGSLAFVIGVCGWLYRDVRRVVSLAFLNSEEAGICGVRGAQAQKDIEERTRGARWSVHVDRMYVYVSCLFRKMQAES